jgi:sterol desaturase/sphingolipid hydroxylase (fatty acid hydroxylase superfamily)
MTYGLLCMRNSVVLVEFRFGSEPLIWAVQTVLEHVLVQCLVVFLHEVPHSVTLTRELDPAVPAGSS